MDLTTALLRAGLVPVTLPWLLVPTQRETGTLHTDKTVERGGGRGGGVEVQGGKTSNQCKVYAPRMQLSPRAHGFLAYAHIWLPLATGRH